MKKLFNFALMGAIALTGATMFTGCSGSDDAVAENNNPNYDPASQTVKSQFVLNIASNAKKNETRSGGTTVQADGNNFRGIDNTLLLAFKTAGTGYIASSSTTAESRYDLGMLAAAGSLDNDGSNSHRILELSMPTGTDAMLFYGKAIRGGSYDANEMGSVNYNISGSTPSGFSFALNPRVATTDVNRFHYTGELLAAIMTKVINVSATYTVNTTTYSGWTGASSLTSTWKDLNPTTQARTLSPLETILFKAFTVLTTIGTTEIRGGSSKAILTTVRDLHSVTTSVANATPTSPYEELAKHLAQAINTQITNYFTSATGAPINGFKGVDGIKTSMGGDWNNNWNVVTDTELADFPVVTFTLPEGTAQLGYDDTNNKFTHKKSDATSLLNKATSTDPAAFQYPAELMYYCNSGVRTSDKEKTGATGYPNGVANWDDNDKWDSDWTGTVVTSSTRATAMTKNVNYGVAMLKSTVRIKEEVGALEDNRAALNSGETNKSFTPDKIHFTWTGVIVGGQPGTVDWQYLPTSAFEKLVYDNRVAGSASGTAVPNAAGSASAPNYTILFDNYTTSATQNKVRVALQFVNNGDDFWGRDNLLRSGQTFYLVAELDPAKVGLTAPTWDTYYQVPPLDGSGISTKVTRVFIQDHVTTANFKLNATSLQGAYVSLPDLRSSQLSFGLSVDLDWLPGLTFTEDLGAN